MPTVSFTVIKLSEIAVGNRVLGVLETNTPSSLPQLRLSEVLGSAALIESSRSRFPRRGRGRRQGGG